MTAADKTCLFCKIVAGELPADSLYEDDRVLAFLDVGDIGGTAAIEKDAIADCPAGMVETHRVDGYPRAWLDRVARVEILQPKIAALGDDVGLDELVDPLLGHCSMPPWRSMHSAEEGLAATPGSPDVSGE